MNRLPLCLVLGLLATCGKVVPAGEPLEFRANLAPSETVREFVIVVENRGAGVNAVRESVRFQGTGHCLLTYGGSEIDWRIDPATDDWAFTQQDDALVFRGRCTAR